eukprot:TRINITY_DN58321_c0_g1_i1.p1 TRINITY_DN58321_c0_g1~~TRINITY_DN58321_c0_g1_i1.p1  ORF type:complete len:522 (-),score=71.87 TRINITY_DN58321_c0_g1_i1:55-1620(-)
MRRGFPSLKDLTVPGLTRLGLCSSESRLLKETACGDGPAAALRHLVCRKYVQDDAVQAACAERLQAIWCAATNFAQARAVEVAWHKTFRQTLRRARENLKDLQSRRELGQSLREGRPASSVLSSNGLYIWGGVGRGKSLLMDVFASSFAGRMSELDETGSGDVVTAPVVIRKHYHEFMHELHQRLHQLRQLGAAREAVAIAAKELRRGDVTVLCLDEFQVTSIADAVILQALFKGMLANNIIVVTTSNRPPSELYKNGLNHMLYMPAFIRLLEGRVGVFHVDSSDDYRVIKEQSDTNTRKSQPDFIVLPANNHQNKVHDIPKSATKAALSVAWGRKINCLAVSNGNAWFTFQEICGAPLSADDYLALVELNKLHTLTVTGVPRFAPELHNEARRFTNLVDVLYEHQCRLLCTAEVPLQDLIADMVTMAAFSTCPQVLTECTAGLQDIRIAELDLADARLSQPDAYCQPGLDDASTDGVMGVMSVASASLDESGFAASRCISRLREMNTSEYRAAHQEKFVL